MTIPTEIPDTRYLARRLLEVWYSRGRALHLVSHATDAQVRWFVWQWVRLLAARRGVVA